MKMKIHHIRTKIIAVLMIFVFVTIHASQVNVNAQKRKIPKEPFQIVDAETGETIPEVLIIPHYFKAVGFFIAPEGPSRGVAKLYLKNPFIYKTGASFNVKQPFPFVGLPLFMLFIGQAKDIVEVVVIAKGYRPFYTDDLWGDPRFGGKRIMKLKKVSDEEWNQLVLNELKPFVKGEKRITDHCEAWKLPKDCNIKIKFTKMERKMVQMFFETAN